MILPKQLLLRHIQNAQKKDQVQQSGKIENIK